MWRHKMRISAVRSHTRTFGSCWIICDDISVKLLAGASHYLGRCSQLSGYLNFAHNGLQHANGTFTYFFVDVFSVIKREKFNVFDSYFSNHYEYVFWMKWKLNVKVRSVHSIRRTCDVLQMTTLNDEHIILRWFTIIYISQTCLDICFKANKIHLKIGRFFFGSI